MPRPCFLRYVLVTSSLGKIVVVAPSSAPILAIVDRSGTVNVSTPDPWYSNILPIPPLTVSRLSISKMTSLAVTPKLSAPFSSTPTIRGIRKKYGPPAIATATSRPPEPIASAPKPPQVGVWLSVPNKLVPGAANLSR